MSLKGIDAQIMISRINDFTRDANVLRRGGEAQQSQLAEQNKIRDVKNQQSVVKSVESEKAEMHSGEDADGTGDYHEARQRGEEPEEETPVASNLLLDFDHHKLDVLI